VNEANPEEEMSTVLNELVHQLQPDIAKKHERAVALSQNTESHWLELAQLLVEIHDRGYFRRLGYVHWMDYVAKSGFGIKKRSIFNLLKLARYPYLAKIKHLAYSICLQLSEIEDESILDATLSELSSLSRKDLMMTVSRAAGKESHRKRLLKRIELLEKDLEEARQELASLDENG
jgi:hypothetical protein